MTDWFFKNVSSLTKLFQGRSGDKLLISAMDVNKKVKVNEDSITEWLKYECLWDVKFKAYKDGNVGENALRALRDYSKLFEIILHTQGLT